MLVDDSTYLGENPCGVGVCTAEVGGEVVVGGEVAVVDEVLAGILGVVGPRLRRQPPHQAQHLTVGAQPRVGHRLRQCVYVCRRRRRRELLLIAAGMYYPSPSTRQKPNGAERSV